MTCEEFMEIHGDAELRQYIVDVAKRRSRRKELQEEYVQEAWLAISCAPAGYVITQYKLLVDKVIYSAYWQNHKEQLLCHTVGQHVESAKHKTPEAPTDNDKWFMNKEEHNKNKNWRD